MIHRKAYGGLERSLAVKEHVMLLQMAWVWFPTPTRWLVTIGNSSSGASMPSLTSSAIRHTHALHIHTFRQNTYTKK